MLTEILTEVQQTHAARNPGVCCNVILAGCRGLFDPIPTLRGIQSRKTPDGRRCTL